MGKSLVSLLLLLFVYTAIGSKIYDYPNAIKKLGIFDKNNEIIGYHSQNMPAIDFCSSFYVSPLFTDNMMLQRGNPASVIFGWGKPNTNVVLQFNSQTYNATISSNSADLSLGKCSWKIELPDMDASLNGMTYTMSISNPSLDITFNFKNIQFGDIWICTGQSNMALPLNHTLSWFNESITSTCSDYNIRAINIPRTELQSPNDSKVYFDQQMYWYDALYSNLTLNKFSATCYYFARHLSEMMTSAETPVPLGIVHASWGGSIIEEWISDIAQNPCDWRYCSNYDGKSDEGVYWPGDQPPCTHDPSNQHETPGGLLNGFIYPLSNLSIYGALYYQGEDNGFNPGNALKNQGYSCMLPRMMQEWRELFDLDIPIGIVSLHGWCSEEAANCWSNKNYSDLYSGTVYEPNTFDLPWLRWAQTAEFGRVPNPLMQNAFIAMAYDLMDQGSLTPPPPNYYEGGIHPRNKWLLGKRIALAAMAIAYDRLDIAYSGPVVSDCFINYETEMLAIMIDSDILRNEQVVMKYEFGFQVQINTTFGGWHDVVTSNVNKDNVILIDLSEILAMDNFYSVMVSGIRYGWQDNVGCQIAYDDWKPGENEGFPCIQANASIYSFPSMLPMIPFIFRLDHSGNCLIPYNSSSFDSSGNQVPRPDLKSYHDDKKSLFGKAGDFATVLGDLFTL